MHFQLVYMTDKDLNSMEKIKTPICIVQNISRAVSQPTETPVSTLEYFGVGIINV